MSGPYTVTQRGYDSSGRPIKNTAIKWQVFDKINDRMYGQVYIIQGAFMGYSAADASGSTHALAGCNDIRRWNLTSSQAVRAIDIADSLGDIWWERTWSQGFDPHFHTLLPNDNPLHPDASWQLSLFRQGKNGLSSGTSDMTGRQRPFPVYKFQEDDMFESEDRKKLNTILDRINTGFFNERERDADERQRDANRHAKLTHLMGQQVDHIGKVLNRLKEDDSPSTEEVKGLLIENRKKLLLALKEDSSTDGTPNNPSDETLDQA